MVDGRAALRISWPSRRSAALHAHSYDATSEHIPAGDVIDAPGESQTRGDVRLDSDARVDAMQVVAVTDELANLVATAEPRSEVCLQRELCVRRSGRRIDACVWRSRRWQCGQRACLRRRRIARSRRDQDCRTDHGQERASSQRNVSLRRAEVLEEVAGAVVRGSDRQRDGACQKDRAATRVACRRCRSAAVEQ